MDTDTAALRSEFGKALVSLKAQLADGQRPESIDFTILDALVAGEQDTADPAWLTATPDDLDATGLVPDATVVDPSTPDQV